MGIIENMSVSTMVIISLFVIISLIGVIIAKISDSNQKQRIAEINKMMNSFYNNKKP